MGTACGVHTLQQGHLRVAELAVQVTVTGLWTVHEQSLLTAFGV